MPKWEDVVQALEDPRYAWRTVRGIARQLKATKEEIQDILDKKAEEVVKSSIPANTGEELYTTRRHYNQEASSFAKFTSGVTMTVTSSTSGSTSTSTTSSSSTSSTTTTTPPSQE